MGRAARRRKTGLSGLLLLLVSVAALIYVAALFLDPPTVFQLKDEGYVLAFARRMLEGKMLPYVDAVSHRGPVLYWVVAAVSWVFGADSWAPLRICWLMASLLTATFSYLAARDAGEPFAGGLTALSTVFVSLVLVHPGAGLAFHAEQLVNAFGLAALWLTVRGLGRGCERVRRVDLFVAGSCAALAVLTKQNAAFIAVTLGLWVAIVAAVRPRIERSMRRSMVGAYVAGGLLPLALVIARYAVAGELGTFYYYFVTYNFDVYLANLTPEFSRQALREWTSFYALQLVAGLLLVVWGITRPVVKHGWRGMIGGWARDGFVPTLGLGALLGLLASNATLRSFPHYFLPLVPWFALLLGLALDGGATSLRRRRSLIRLLLALPLLVGTFLLWSWRERYLVRGNQAWRSHSERLCRIVDEHTGPDDPLFVWGFSADLYTWCDRSPASRFVYTTFVAGFVPWWDGMSKAKEDSLAVPGSRELLLSELERAKPRLIIDAGAKTLMKRHMNRYQLLANYLDGSYCPPFEWDGFRFYRRRAPGIACPNTP